MIQASRALADLKAFGRFQAGEPGSPDLANHLKTLHSATATLVDTTSDRLEGLFEEFNYIQDLENYCVAPNARVTCPGKKKLPDPKQDWVDMIYRIKGGRLDNDFGPIQEENRFP